MCIRDSINTASLSGLCAGRGGCAYTTSKFGVVGLTKNVAFMYGDAGIRCNAICPGNTQTNIGVGMRQPSQLGMSKATTGYSGATRSGKPEEVAAAAVFLASGEAVFINGETLTIDEMCIRDRDGVTWYFLDNEYYFGREYPYGFFDDGERIAFFAKAVCECIQYLDFMPDVLHCNDWHTALSPVFLREMYHCVCLLYTSRCV